MSDEILGVLTAIHKDVGEIKGKLDSHVAAFEQHVADDRQAYSAIIGLKTAQARQRGFLTAVGVMGSGMGAALGWLVEKLIGVGHSH